jgi:hypothetical protein
MLVSQRHSIRFVRSKHQTARQFKHTHSNSTPQLLNTHKIHATQTQTQTRHSKLKFLHFHHFIHNTTLKIRVHYKQNAWPICTTMDAIQLIATCYTGIGREARYVIVPLWRYTYHPSLRGRTNQDTASDWPSESAHSVSCSRTQISPSTIHS